MLAEWVASSVFNEIAILLVLAAAVGFVGVLLRQPLIVSFIAVGIIAGPSVLDVVHSEEPIDLLAELGIAVLLFLVGIKLDVKLIQTLGPVALATGLGQVAFTSIFGFLICLGLGLDALTSLYVAVALTFSSTIIIVKLLSDKREIDTLHGRIALGFLIVQDLVVVFAMIALSAVGVGARSEAGTGDVLGVLGASLLMLGVVVLLVKYIANPLTEKLARAPELLVSFAVAMAAAFAAAGDALGFGKELGGLMAGVALASTPYRDAIAARLTPLRDFLLLFFFIALGAGLDIGNLGQSGAAAAVLSAFVLIGNPLIVLLIMGALGYHRRTGFLAGLTVAQISEFSLLFMAMGLTLGHVTEDAVGLVTLVGLVTIAASTYMITYSHQLYAFCDPLLRLFDRRRPGNVRGEAPLREGAPDVLVCGLGRYGEALGRRLADSGYRILGVDLNPAAVRAWSRQGFEAVYGDASDPELIATLPLSGVKWVMFTARLRGAGVTHLDPRVVLMQQLREFGFAGRIAVSATDPSETEFLRNAGADLVMEPFEDAAELALAYIREIAEADDAGANLS